MFSFLPAAWYHYRIGFALCGVLILVVMNLRGVRESVLPLVPIFLTFLLTHVAVILYVFITHLIKLPAVVQSVSQDVYNTRSEIGLL